MKESLKESLNKELKEFMIEMHELEIQDIQKKINRISDGVKKLKL